MNDARFAIVQRSLDVPEVEKLKRAFRAVKCLTPSDAHTLANDAFGILVKNLDITDAMALEGALQDEGIDTAVVMEKDLPELPPIKFVRQVDCRLEYLMVCDPIGREVPVQWGHVMLIAAGNVEHFEMTRIAPKPPASPDFREPRTLRERIMGDDIDPLIPDDRIDREDRRSETRVRRAILEIVLGRVAMRFHIEAEKFRFNYLGDRKTGSVPENFKLLALDLMTFAPHALVNRGAFYLRGDSPTLFEYPSRNAFYEEITWMLWRVASARAESS